MPRLPADTSSALIVQRAAELFAAHGVNKTSLQDIASGLGVSKAAVLHHFGSRAGLERAVTDEAAALVEQTVAPLRGQPEGRERDIAAVVAIVACAFQNPGLVALVLGAQAAGDGAERLSSVESVVFEAFHDRPFQLLPERIVRVSAALAATGLVAMSAHRQGHVNEWQPTLVAACVNALGHYVQGQEESK